MAALVGLLGELGYGWAYRVLDAQHFGVPQRRRRVFIVALDAQRGPGAERAAEVLSVGSRCDRHPPTGHEAGPGAAKRVADGPVGTFTAGAHPGSYNGQDAYTGHLIGSSPDPGGVRAPDGLAGRLDDRDGVAKSLLAKGNDSHAHDLDNYVVATLNSGGNSGGFRTEPGEHLVYRKATKAHHGDDWERWERTDRTDTLDAEGLGALQATAVVGQPAADSELLPVGLDSHRYRCCGNGVVSSVAEWIGLRLLETLAGVTLPVSVAIVGRSG